MSHRSKGEAERERLASQRARETPRTTKPRGRPTTSKKAGVTLLQERIAARVKRHGSIRAAALVLRVDHVYLWRLLQGKMNNPGDALLRRLKLRRIVTVTYEATDL